MQAIVNLMRVMIYNKKGQYESFQTRLQYLNKTVVILFCCFVPNGFSLKFLLYYFNITNNNVLIIFNKNGTTIYV